MSAELTTAVAEYEQDIGIRPGTFCAYDVRVDGVLDLTTPEVLTALDIDLADRYAPWKSILLVKHETPPGWRIADRLTAQGPNGAIVPSVRPTGGRNLVLWRWNDHPSRVVTALDPQTDLPRDASSRQ